MNYGVTVDAYDARGDSTHILAHLNP